MSNIIESNIIQTLLDVRASHARDVLEFIKNISDVGGVYDNDYHHDVEEVVYASDNHERVKILFFASRKDLYKSFQVVLVEQTYPRKIVASWARSMPHSEAIRKLPNEVNSNIRKRVMQRRAKRASVAA